MSDYHRTQIQLEKWQYAKLKERASEEGVSLCVLIRRIIQDEFQDASTEERDNLKEIRGRWSDPGFSSKDHDEAIYGLKG